MGRRVGFFASHSKSSAILVSLAVHAGIIVAALFFVAVTVIQKTEVDFEAKTVSRPKMNLRRLKVPVNVNKQVRQPKMRKQIVVAPKVAKVMPDVRLPEIVGVRGGFGGASGGLGSVASLGFSVTELDMFGIKSKGEKVFIMLDASPEMMLDEMGGIPAYSLIKEEVLSMIEGLPPTSLFNISVYEYWNTYMLFPTLVAASPENVQRARAWLEPLNAVRPGMGSDEYGAGTLGPGGRKYDEDLRTGKFESQELWHRSAMLAMKQQADTVFILTSFWGHQRIAKNDPAKEWYTTAAGERWLEYHEKAKQMLDEENRQRAANGQPPRVIRRENAWDMIDAYFADQGLERPPEPDFYYYTPREFVEGFLEVRQRYKSAEVSVGIKKKKLDFEVNVVHFKKVDAEENYFRDVRTLENFKKLTSLCNGEYRTLAGLEAIRSSVQQ